MRNFLFLLVFASLPFLASAQLADLLKDPNVTWAATYEMNRDFKITSQRTDSEIQLTKFIPTESGCADFKNDNWLSKWVIDGMKAGRYKAFDDPSMKVFVGQPILLERISYSNVVTTFNPETYEEKIQVIKNDIKPEEIFRFKSSEVIYYDKKAGIYQTRLLALAPMVHEVDNNGNIKGESPIAWLAMSGTPPSSQNDIIWSVLLMDKSTKFNLDNMTVVKDERKKPFITSLWEDALSGKIEVKSSEKYGCGELFSSKELEQSFTLIDTIITFDPDTHKETTQVVKHNYDEKDVKSINLVQEWYFDDKRKMVGCRLKAIAPVLDVKDSQGILLYNRTMFYMYY